MSPDYYIPRPRSINRATNLQTVKQYSLLHLVVSKVVRLLWSAVQHLPTFVVMVSRLFQLFYLCFDDSSIALCYRRYLRASLVSPQDSPEAKARVFPSLCVWFQGKFGKQTDFSFVWRSGSTLGPPSPLRMEVVTILSYPRQTLQTPP